MRLHPPAEFAERHLFGGHLWVRKGWEERLPLAGASLESAFRGVAGVQRFEGRGAVWSAPAGEGRAVLRHYRHGGALAKLTGDVFFGRTPRPVRELAVSEELRRRGVRTPEVLALWWGWSAPWVYRADLVTRQVEGGRDLLDFLKHIEVTERRRRVPSAVGRALAAMHEAGLHHPDLNMKNLLVREHGRACSVYVLDLDRATVGTPLIEKDRVHQLKRLERSLRKLSRGRALASERETLAVLRAYYGSGWRARAGKHWRLA